jgi:hypothetical protein
VIHSNEEDRQQMKIAIDECVINFWKEQFVINAHVKVDDVSDALLHALNDLYCGSSNYKQLLPVTPSLYNNRTIAISVLPDVVYCVVVTCSWNVLIFEDFVSYNPRIPTTQFYKSSATVNIISSSFPDTVNIALQDMTGAGIFSPVDSIKVIVKQQTANSQHFMESRVKAGALTNSAVEALHRVCDNVMGPDSNLSNKKRKGAPYAYYRFCKTTGRKYHVSRSTGKHTNAVLCCLGWFRDNMKQFVSTRRQVMNGKEKRKFFHALHSLAETGGNRLEMLQLSNTSVEKLSNCDMGISNYDTVRNIADLLLISMNNNQNYVKAVAANSRSHR